MFTNIYDVITSNAGVSWAQLVLGFITFSVLTWCATAMYYDDRRSAQQIKTENMLMLTRKHLLDVINDNTRLRVENSELHACIQEFVADELSTTLPKRWHTDSFGPEWRGHESNDIFADVPVPFNVVDIRGD